MSTEVLKDSGINIDGSKDLDKDYSFPIGELSDEGSAIPSTIGRVSYSSLKEDGTFDVVLTGHSDRLLREEYVLTAEELVGWFNNRSEDYYNSNIKVKLS